MNLAKTTTRALERIVLKPLLVYNAYFNKYKEDSMACHHQYKLVKQ